VISSPVKNILKQKILKRKKKRIHYYDSREREKKEKEAKSLQG